MLALLNTDPLSRHLLPFPFLSIVKTCRYGVTCRPKYRFPAHIDFSKCRETIASALNDYCTRWCKREQVESNALNNWKLKIFKIIDERVLFYTNNLDPLLPKPKLSFRYLKQGIQEFHRKYVLVQLVKLLIMLFLCDDFIISIL